MITRRIFVAGSAGALIVALTAPAMAVSAPKVTEKEVSIKTPDGTAQGVLFSPAKGRKAPAVLLWPDLAGLRPSITTWGRELAAAGYVVLIPNAYYRSGPAATGEVNMADPEIRKRQTEYRATASDDGVARDAVAYIAFLDAQKQTDKRRKIGTVGYDVGGSYAFRAAAAVPERVGAVAVVYGLGVATARPNSPHLLVPKSKAAYHIVMSKDDDAREPEDKTDIRKVIADSGLQGTVEVSTANHGFATPGSPAADAAETTRWNGELVTFLKARL